MTVEKLIQILQSYPKDTVVFSGSEGGPYELGLNNITITEYDENFREIMGWYYESVKLNDIVMIIGG